MGKLLYVVAARDVVLTKGSVDTIDLVYITGIVVEKLSSRSDILILFTILVLTFLFFPDIVFRSGVDSFVITPT